MTVPAQAPVLRFHLDDSQLDSAFGTRRVAVSGEVDLATSPALRSTLLAALDGPPMPGVLQVDLAGVGFLDSTGIGALIGVRNHAITKECLVQLTGLQPPVRRVLAVTGLLEGFLQPA